MLDTGTVIQHWIPPVIIYRDCSPLYIINLFSHIIQDYQENDPLPPSPLTLVEQPRPPSVSAIAGQRLDQIGVYFLRKPGIVKFFQ